MSWNNVVIDDLREFKDTPPAMQGQVLYLKEMVEAFHWVRKNLTKDWEAKVIKNLWLDFDLGNNCTSKLICLELASANTIAEDAGEPWTVTVENLWIFTANPIGRKEIIALAPYFAKSFHVINPIDFGLINEVDW